MPPGAPDPHVQIPAVRVDPLASLRTWDIEVTLAGLDILIPRAPAVDWLIVLLAEDPPLDRLILDHLSPAEAGVVDEALLDGTLGAEEFRDTILDVIAEASGRDWWFTLRLCGLIRGAWDRVAGGLTLAGVDARTMPLGAWLDAAYWHVVNLSDPKEVVRLISDLSAPPPGFEVPFDDTTDGDAFLAAMMQG